jgi:hypothetical protein
MHSITATAFYAERATSHITFLAAPAVAVAEFTHITGIVLRPACAFISSNFTIKGASTQATLAVAVAELPYITGIVLRPACAFISGNFTIWSASNWLTGIIPARR